MRKILVLLAIIMGGVSCDTSPDLVNCDFDEQEMLSNYSDELIIPRLTDFSLSLFLFESIVNEFAATPSIGLLNEVRILYGTAYLQYQECSAFQFGPGLISGVPFTERFNTFPTYTLAILDNVSNGLEVTSAAKSSVGFPAIDYLLFVEPGTSNDDVLSLFTADALAANRMTYLQQLATELKTVSAQMEQGWLASGGNYRTTFINNTGTAEGSSISLLANSFNFDFETMKNFKFKIPLGKFNGGIVLPEKVEAYYAEESIQLVKAQLESFKLIYEGTGTNGADGPGFYEYLACLEITSMSGGLLADDIRSQFESIEQALEPVSDPMSEALVSDFATVDNIYSQMQIMVPKIKHEMTSALTVQINYQDNDGD
jgi:predicted lipoprotein